FPKALTAIYGEETPRPPVLYFESLDHFRDFLYVEDAVRALLLVASTEACQGDVFNALACTHGSTPEILKRIVEACDLYEREIDPGRAQKIVANGITIAMAPPQSGATA